MKPSSSAARRKRGGQESKQQQQHQQQIDAYHNRDVPCCHLVRKVTLDVFPEAYNTTAAAAGSDVDNQLLGSLLRQHLVLQSQTPSSNHKKKKRRKKKKKNTPPVDIAALALDTTSAAATGVEEKDTTIMSSQQTTATATVDDDDYYDDDTVVRQWVDRIQTTDTDSTAACPKNRDLQSFVQYLQQQQDKFNSTTSLPTIDLHRVQEACDSIACSACRQSALSYWRSLVVVSSSLSQEMDLRGSSYDDDDANIPIIISPSSIVIPKSSLLTLDNQGGDDIDRAFDYVAMEEGIVESSSKDDSMEIISLQRNGSVLHTTTVPSMQDVHNLWMKRLLLPCGLPELENTMSDEQFQSIVNAAKEKESKITLELNGISHKLHEMRITLDETAATTCSFDVKTSTLLLDMDTEFDIIFHSLFTILLQITTTSTSATRVKNSMERLWQCLTDTTVSTILQAQQAHEGRLVQLSNRPGVVPQMALNASHRSSYRTFLSTKLTALQTLVDQLMHELWNSNDEPVYRTFVVYKLYYPSSSNSDHDLATTMPNVDARLWELYEEETHTVRCGNLKEMADIHKKRCEQLLEAAILLNQSLAGYACNDESLKSEFQSLHDTILLEQRGHSSTAEHNDDEQDEALLKLRQHVALLTTNVLAQWRCCLWNSSTKKARQPLPLKLKRWMSGEICLVSENNDACSGGGGKRRVTCILMGLLYQWLADRCKEWHAELTQNELLEMDDEPLDTPSGEVVNNKSSKAKKSKKKKKASASDDAVSPNTRLDNGRATENAVNQITPEKKDDGAKFVGGKKSSSAQSPPRDHDSTANDGTRHDNVNVENASKTGPSGTTNGGPQTVEPETHVAVSPSKSKKKKKNKVKKRSTSNEAASNTRLDASSESALDQSSGQNDSAKVGCDNDDIKSPPQHDASSRNVALDHSTVEIGPKTGSRSANDGTQKQNEHDKAESPPVQEKEEKFPQTTPVDVGVVSATGFQSAEGYLVERLVAALRAQKQGKNIKIVRR